MKQRVAFVQQTLDETTGKGTEVIASVEGDPAEYVVNLLDAFKAFLNELTFNVDSVSVQMGEHTHTSRSSED